MNCIGEKCPFCHEHEFRLSYCYCGLDGIGFKKDNYSDYQCIINDELEKVYNKYNKLKQIRDTILKHQKVGDAING